MRLDHRLHTKSAPEVTGVDMASRVLMFALAFVSLATGTVAAVWASRSAEPTLVPLQDAASASEDALDESPSKQQSEKDKSTVPAQDSQDQTQAPRPEASEPHGKPMLA
jgi:hypothetical protein